jgi:microcystin degradation protein MlrC
MRIAVGGIHIECSTYNPHPTLERDFRIVRGAELLQAPNFAYLKDFEAEFLPLLHARAVPGGPVSRATYEALKADFLGRLCALGALDGLYLSMHGAMFVEGLEDAEGDWISAARDAVGPDCTIAASYDLHGNLSPRVIDALDIFTAYRTAPHIDVDETRRRGLRMLIRALREGVRPFLVWAPIPVVLPGERTSTEDEPAKRLYARLAPMEAQPGVWDAALMVGYVWADEPRVTACVVMTGTDEAVLANEAKALAQAYWDARESFTFGMWTGGVQACIERALASPTRPVVLADSGDNPTAGGVGDRADLLRALLEAGATGALVAGIADGPAVQRCLAAGAGASVRLDIGHSLHPAGGRPLRVDAVVRSLSGGPAQGAPHTAVVDIQGLTLVLCEARRPYHLLSDFTELGLDPLSARLIVVKSGYLSPELAAIARPGLMALSPGVVDQDVERLPRPRKVRPTFPFDRDFSFEPQAIRSRPGRRSERN